MLSSNQINNIEHGGSLIKAIDQYKIPREDWLDLSTGINPDPWPCPQIPAEHWHKLPENYESLINAAENYYQTKTPLIPINGLQSIINWLPFLLFPNRKNITALIQRPAYEEHQKVWQQNSNNKIILAHTEDEINQKIIDCSPDLLIIVNPNNPTSRYINLETLMEWSAQLRKRGGWLFVDEAFVDVCPERSLLIPHFEHELSSNTVVYRSLGKFFGLAGARIGFIFSNQELIGSLENLLEPWQISGPSAWVAEKALNDAIWQDNTFRKIAQTNQVQLKNILNTLHQNKIFENLHIKSSGLFMTLYHPLAKQIHVKLALQGIWTRWIERDQLLRIGLAKPGKDLNRLLEAIKLVAL